MFDFSGDIETTTGDDIPRIATILFRVFVVAVSSSECHDVDSWWDQTANLSEIGKFSPEELTPTGSNFVTNSYGHD